MMQATYTCSQIGIGKELDIFDRSPHLGDALLSATSRGVSADCTEIVTAGWMASLDKARTRCMSGEVQNYQKESYTWNIEEEWREKEAEVIKEREGGIGWAWVSEKWREKGRWFVKEEW